MGVVDVVLVESKALFELGQHGLVVQGRVRGDRGTTRLVRAICEWSMGLPIRFRAGVWFEVIWCGGPFVNGVCIAEALGSALSRCPESICEAVSGEMVSVKIGEDRLPICCLESILEGSVGRVRVRAEEIAKVTAKAVHCCCGGVSRPEACIFSGGELVGSGSGMSRCPEGGSVCGVEGE